MKDHIDQRLMEFLYDRTEPFTIDELFAFLGAPGNKQSRESLSGYLLYHQFAYVNVSDDGYSEYWITRAGLFTGAVTLIRPSAHEIASGILVPGSRLVPFINPALLPHELSFVFASRPLPRTPVTMNTASLYPLYRFFGEEYTPQFLSLDNDRNAELFSGNDFVDPEECIIQAVDLKEVYWKESFTPGDLLRARVINWREGVVELSVLPAGQRDVEREKSWIRLFEESIVNVFELVGPGASMDEQLSFAFYLNQSLLSENNPACLYNIIEKSERIGIEPYGVESRLWYRNMEIPAQGTWNMAIVSAPENTAEGAFMQLGLPVSDQIMQAYILDALFLKEDTIDAMFDRLVPVHGTTPSFCIPEIRRAAGERFAYLQSRYNWFADHEQGTLRNRFVVLHNALTVFILHLQHVGIVPNQIPDQGAVILGQIMAHAISALELLSETQAVPDAETESLWVSIEGMEDSFFETKTAIQEVLPGLLKSRFSVIKEGENPNE